MPAPGIPTGVHVLFRRDDGAVLLMRRAGTGFFDGLFSLPGGHVEPGESLAVAAARECREELDVSVAPQALRTLGVVHRLSDSNRIDFFLSARTWEGTPRIAEPHKCDALAWFPPDRLPDATVPYIAHALNMGDGPWLFEMGW